MKFEMAPLEGITTYLYRNAFAHYFGGVDRYYTPFLSLHRDKEFNWKEMKEILPEHNRGLKVIPQVLTNSAEDFLKAAARLEELGYNEVNLNFGCPSGTVTAKGKGAGILENPGKLDAFLAEIFDKVKIGVSVKTRLGMYEAQEWDRLLAIYRQYPLRELIVHARVRQDFYTGSPNLDAFGKALLENPFPVCYNGDIFSKRDFKELEKRFPGLSAVMLGRGLLARPWLVQELCQASGAAETYSEENTKGDSLRAFHEELYRGYLEIQYGERNTLFRMKELWTYMIKAFAQAERYEKKIKKARSCAEYESITAELFAACPLI